MRKYPALRIGGWIVGLSIAVLGLWLQAQSPEAAPVRDAPSIAPRAAPADYQSTVQVGTVTIAADFTGHSIATPQAVFTSEDYVVVEVALFGPPEGRLMLAAEDFSLRINGKKVALPSQPYGLVVKSSKDPEWEPPPSAAKSKSSVGTGGGGPGDSNIPPPPPKMPIGVRRAMEQRIQKAAFPEGDRPLPQAGLIFFPHRGKTQNIQKLELLYGGPAGKAVLALQP